MNERLLNRTIDLLRAEKEAFIKDKDNLLRQINRQNDEIEALKDEIAYKKNTIELLNVSRNNLMEDLKDSQEEVAALVKQQDDTEDRWGRILWERTQRVRELNAAINELSSVIDNAKAALSNKRYEELTK